MRTVRSLFVLMLLGLCALGTSGCGDGNSADVDLSLLNGLSLFNGWSFNSGCLASAGAIPAGGVPFAPSSSEPATGSPAAPSAESPLANSSEGSGGPFGPSDSYSESEPAYGTGDETADPIAASSDGTDETADPGPLVAGGVGLAVDSGDGVAPSESSSYQDVETPGLASEMPAFDAGSDSNDVAPTGEGSVGRAYAKDDAGQDLRSRSQELTGMSFEALAARQKGASAAVRQAQADRVLQLAGAR